MILLPLLHGKRDGLSTRRENTDANVLGASVYPLAFITVRWSWYAQADIPRTNWPTYRGNPPENVGRPVRAAPDGSDGITLFPSAPERAGKSAFW